MRGKKCISIIFLLSLLMLISIALSSVSLACDCQSSINPASSSVTQVNDTCIEVTVIFWDGHPGNPQLCLMTVDWGDGNVWTGPVPNPSGQVPCSTSGWSNTTCNVVVLSHCYTYDIVGLCDTTINASIDIWCDCGGCTPAPSIDLRIEPKVDIFPDWEVCLGDTVRLAARPGRQQYTYTWDLGDGTVFIDTTYSIDYVYTTYGPFSVEVTMTDPSANCSKADTVSVIVETLFSSYPDTVEKCFGDTVQISGTITLTRAPYHVSWTPTTGINCTNCIDPIHYDTVSGLYVINIADRDTICSIQDSVYVKVNPLPEVSIISDSICLNDTGSLFAQVTSGTPPYSYLWTPPSGLSCTTCSNPDVLITSSQWYYVEVIDTKGCSNSDSAYVEVYPLPIFSIDDTAICQYDTVQRTIPVGVSWQWVPNYYISCTNCQNILLYPPDTTTYIAIAYSDKGCLWKDTFTIYPVPWPEPSLPERLYMCEEEVTLINAGNATYYNWIVTKGVSCSYCGETILKGIHSNDFDKYDTTLYIVEYKNQIGCTLYDSMTLIVAPLPRLRSGDTTICYYDCAIAHTDGAWEYLWISPVEDNPFSSSVSVCPTQSDSQIILYVVGWTDSTLCPIDTAIFKVDIDFGSIPTAYQDTAAFPGDTVSFIGYYDSAAYNILWFSPDGFIIEHGNPITALAPLRVGEVDTFIFQTETFLGCLRWDTVTVMALYIPECEEDVWIPNAFTPNGDGVNDVLYIHSIRPVKVKLWRIYNRWGELLFEARDLPISKPLFRTEIGWDGTFQGEPLRPDVFVYYYWVECDGKLFFEKGDVTLIR